MTKVIVILFLAALGCSAGMIPGGPCATDTYANYGALGTAGCTIEGRLFYNFSPSMIAGSGTGGVIVLTVTPNDSGSDASVGLTFTGSLPLGPTILTVPIYYAVSATSPTPITRSSASFNLWAMSTGAASVSEQLFPVPYGGVSFQDTVAENSPLAAKTETLPPMIVTVKGLRFVNQFQFTTSPSDFNITSFTNTFQNVPSDSQIVAPEPGTLALAGAGALLLLAGRKLRAQPKA